jgi:translation initiation factor 2 beta subunit (eIF-2beta)/eIF-5
MKAVSNSSDMGE